MPATSAARAFPAFPGAEGFGSAATGGRGGAVIYVEHLEDAFVNEPLYAGSLRKALEGTTGPRTVVFRRGGIIRLKAAIRILDGHGDLTIAGQTAPGGGIGLARLEGDPVSNQKMNLLRIEASNVIVRHLRLRPGFLGGARGPCTNCERKSTALSIRNGAQRVIVDHVSMSWGNDGSVELDGLSSDGLFPAPVKNVTIQWSIISEGITLDPVLDPSQGLTSFHAVDRVSLHHNLFAHNQIRNPSLTSGGYWEIVNNVIYDTPNAASELYDQVATERTVVDYVGNYAAQPAASPSPGPYELRLFKWIDELVPTGFSLFLDGNIAPSRTSDGSPDAKILQCRIKSCDGCSLTLCDAAYPDRWLRPTAAAPSPPSPTPITVDFNPAYRDLWTYGLQDRVGATLPVRDRVDACVANQIETWTGSVIRGLGSGCAAGGWTLASGSAVVDRDGDGMPDAYEAQYPDLLDAAAADDGVEDPDGDCYTNLEEYLNATPPDGRDARALRAPPFLGIAAEDGQLQESAPGSGTGAAVQPGSVQIKVGDDARDAERRGVFSFDTSALPDGATVCHAVLTLSPLVSVGSPAGLGAIHVVSPLPRGTPLGAAPALEPADFQARTLSPSPSYVLRRGSQTFVALVKPGSVATAGRTQVRAQVASDGDGIEDAVVVYSADAHDPALRPKLTVTYQP